MCYMYVIFEFRFSGGQRVQILYCLVRGCIRLFRFFLVGLILFFRFYSVSDGFTEILVMVVVEFGETLFFFEFEGGFFSFQSDEIFFSIIVFFVTFISELLFLGLVDGRFCFMDFVYGIFFSTFLYDFVVLVFMVELVFRFLELL